MHLDVNWLDSSYRIEPDERGEQGVTFGRGAEIDVDSNPFLHRRVGRFVFCDGTWWIENLSDWSPISVRSHGAATLLSANSRAAIGSTDVAICFEAGPCNYELTVHLNGVPELPPAEFATNDLTDTWSPPAVVLNEEQRLLVTALAEPWLLDRHYDGRMPTNRNVAMRLGWSDAKFNRKLDYLCKQMEGAGLVGLHGGEDRALGRRDRLVAHMIATRQITADDLVLLGGPDGARCGHTSAVEE